MQNTQLRLADKENYERFLWYLLHHNKLFAAANDVSNIASALAPPSRVSQQPCILAADGILQHIVANDPHSCWG
jgi:hypothetical protein